MRYIVGVIFLALFAALAGAQEPPPSVHGSIVSTDGKPVAGATVYGDDWACCPAEREILKTAGDGSFAFSHPTKFVRVNDPRFEPITVFVDSGQPELRIVLSDADPTAKTIRGCPSHEERGKRVGIWFRFELPQKTRIKRTLDADTVSYYISFPHSDYVMRIWSGVTLGGTRADDRLMKDSSSFGEKWIGGPGVPGIGIDTTGTLRDGKPWRWFGTAVDLATYSDVPEEAARYFDAIINGACLSQTILTKPAEPAEP